MRGRDLVTGLPKEIMVNDTQLRKAMARSLATIMQTTRDVIEETPPELVSDIMTQGIILAGGGGLLKSIDKLITRETMMPAIIADDPVTAVVRGCGMVLEHLDELKEVLVSADSAPIALR